MLHQIDLRDHGMFTSGGQHPLAFLTLPEWLWRAMTSNAGGAPNRRLFPYYRQRFAALGYDARYHITHVLGRALVRTPWRSRLTPGVDYTEGEIEQVQEIRQALRPEYRAFSDEDLLVTGIFVRALKASTAPARSSPWTASTPTATPTVNGVSTRRWLRGTEGSMAICSKRSSVR